LTRPLANFGVLLLENLAVVRIEELDQWISWGWGYIYKNYSGLYTRILELAMHGGGSGGGDVPAHSFSGGSWCVANQVIRELALVLERIP